MSSRATTSTTTHTAAMIATTSPEDGPVRAGDQPSSAAVAARIRCASTPGSSCASARLSSRSSEAPFSVASPSVSRVSVTR